MTLWTSWKAEPSTGARVPPRCELMLGLRDVVGGAGIVTPTANKLPCSHHPTEY